MTRPGAYGPNGLARVAGCLGQQADIPCVPVARGVIVCPRCRGATPVGERLIGPRVPLCECYAAICGHFALTGVRSTPVAIQRGQPRCQ